jgi:hypothetical protein
MPEELSELERLEVLVANLLIMQKISVTKLDAVTSILESKGYLTQEDMDAVNEDIKDVLSDTGSE